MSIRYPWPSFRSPLTCEILELEVDGGVRADIVDESSRRVRLDALSDWRTVSLQLRAYSTEKPPPGEDLSAQLLVSCPRTQLRAPFPMHRLGEGQWHGRAELPAQLLAGSAQIEVSMYALVDGRIRSVGSAETWTLVVDAGEAPLPSGIPPFASSWISFSSAEAPMTARQFPENPAFLDLSGSEPVLYLNSDVDGFQRILTSDTARLERRRHRDLFGSSIARYVIGTLVREAAAEIAVSDLTDPVESPAGALSRDVCRAIATQLQGIEGVDAFYAQLGRAHLEDRSTRTSLWQQIDMAVDVLASWPDLVARVSNEVKHV